MSPAMKRWLVHEARCGNVNILHNHSLWMETNCYTAAAAQGTASKLVISPRGTLAAGALRRRRVVKTMLWPLLVGRATHGASAFHATSVQEYRDIRRAGFRQPVALLPNGIDVPEWKDASPGPRRKLLFLGRLHPIKGIDRLLRAWSDLQGRHRAWDLVIAGPDEGGYEAQLRALANGLGLERVTFAGPLFGADKLAAYRAADLYVLPTHTENFAMTVAEALAAGTPVVTTRGAPWAGLETERCGWWSENSETGLLAALNAAMTEASDSLKARGLSGREWMIRDFGWQAIAADMLRFYSWLRTGGQPPEFVRID